MSKLTLKVQIVVLCIGFGVLSSCDWCLFLSPISLIWCLFISNKAWNLWIHVLILMNLNLIIHENWCILNLLSESSEGITFIGIKTWLSFNWFLAPKYVEVLFWCYVWVPRMNSSFLLLNLWEYLQLFTSQRACPYTSFTRASLETHVSSNLHVLRCH